MTAWYEYTVGVPFGNPNYDVGLGGSHDKTFCTPPNMEITNIVKGKITDLSEPSWGKQMTIEMSDGPVNGHAYFAILHFSALNPALKVGEEIDVDTVVGWSGGCVSSSQYNGTSNPTGENFLNSPAMSSRPQIGIALCDGPAYGGIGWKEFPPIDMSLDPSIIVENYIKNHTTKTPQVDYVKEQFLSIWSRIVPGVPSGLGIGIAALNDFRAGMNRGPALSHEFQMTMPDGSTATAQLFCSGFYTWTQKNGCVWHGYKG